MKGKKIVFTVLFVICIISYCNYVRKPKPILGVTYFDIPILMSKNIDEVIKLVGFYTRIEDGNGEGLSSLIIENNGWRLNIGFDDITRKIEGIGLSQDHEKYERIEFHNGNIDLFLKVGNLERKSYSYELFLSETITFIPSDVIEHHIDDDYNNIVNLNVLPLAPKIIYDIPKLIDKNIDDVRQIMSNNLSKKNEKELQDLSTKVEHTTFEKDGSTLFVTSNSQTRNITSIKIVLDKGGFENSKDLLRLGNLDFSSNAYICVVGKVLGSFNNKFNSVSIYPN